MSAPLSPGGKEGIGAIPGTQTKRRPLPIAGDARLPSKPPPEHATLLTITGLTAGTTYQVRLVGFDAAANDSPVSEEITIPPVETQGFFGSYLEAGGTGGCSAVPGAWPAFATLLFAAVRSRSRRRGAITRA